MVGPGLLIGGNIQYGPELSITFLDYLGMDKDGEFWTRLYHIVSLIGPSLALLAFNLLII